MWIAYPEERYEELLDYFQFSDLSYSDFIPEEYETEPIAGFGFPPPRYSFSFISKEMDLAVVKVPSKEFNTIYYRNRIKGMNKSEIAEIDLFMRCDFVKYKNAVAAVAANHHCLPPSITVVAPPAPAAVVHYLRSPRFAFARPILLDLLF